MLVDAGAWKCSNGVVWLRPLRILETIKCFKQWQGTVSPFLQANVYIQNKFFNFHHKR